MHKFIMQLIFLSILTAATKATDLGSELQEVLHASSLTDDKKESIMNTFNRGSKCVTTNDKNMLGRALQDNEVIKYEDQRP